MASFHSGRPGQAEQHFGAEGRTGGAPDEMLAPVIAGAYARGIADLLDALGLPGLFLDRSGEVLFASRAAKPLLQGALRLHMRHVVAEHAEDNQALGPFIAEAVGGTGDVPRLHLPKAAIVLQKLPRTEGSDLPGQMVRAVLLMASDADPRHAAMLALVA